MFVSSYIDFDTFVRSYFYFLSCTLSHKDVHLHRAFRIGRRIMLTAGIVLVLRALLGGFELFFKSELLMTLKSRVFPAIIKYGGARLAPPY